MVIETRTRQLPVITETTVLNEANACTTDRPLDTKPLAEERAFAFWQKDIPEAYWGLDGAALAERIARREARLGSRCVVLGHHYQREDIIQFADYRGDSFNLARWAAERGEAEFIVFCGVHFMAESADILSQPAPDRSSCRTCPPAARWPTWRTRTTSTPAGTSASAAARDRQTSCRSRT